VVDALEVAPQDLLVALARISDAAFSIWEVHTETPGSGQVAQHLTDWRPERIEQLSASSNGRRVAFLSTSSQSDVYVADFDAQIGLTGAPRQLTRDEFDDWPFTWTPDGSSLIVLSNRNGNKDIFKQRLDK
jgi:Tol biopolymer transport system component